MTKILGSLMSSSKSPRVKASPSGPTILGVPIYTLGGDKLRIRDNDFDLTPENFKALSSLSYSGKTMKDGNDFFMMNIPRRDLGYTGVGDGKSNRKTFSTKKLPKLVDEIQKKTFEEFMENSDNDLNGTWTRSNKFHTF